MANKMLIDAAHPEETRVVVLRGKRVDEFDYESASRKQLRGNIYLAKVTRVEPSLQAAFVDYGGNRHGFLAFSEIHPDYYQIPVADRQALLEEEALAEAEDAALDELPAHLTDSDDNDDDSSEGNGRRSRRRRGRNRSRRSRDNVALEANTDDDVLVQEVGKDSSDETEESGLTIIAPEETAARKAEAQDNVGQENDGSEENENYNIEDDLDIVARNLYDPESSEEIDDDGDDEEDDVESVGSEDALEELPQRPRRRRRVYKIQEVIRRRQVILVQVVKEERGNKGAALTTYLSLAGRHTVLMPNTARGGGISRKITNPADRKRLRKIAGELEVPEGTGLIIRTAGASRTKAEIKRDYEYLLRLWENVRDLTMESTAPSVVYEEGDLIKRSIRDLYSKEIDEVLVAGEHSYKDAKSFMRMIMPSHAKNVRLYKDSEPLFIKHQIERQLNEMYSPYVTLPSGGYIVINQTEALVSVDVNSGKSTKEHSIEDTALRTNLEASEEISRQLRLRDLAGLVVIDFIDMDERRNNRAVERKLKECLKNDRARIQVGRISHFGLLEMSRQRLRTGVLEGSTTQCPHCQGTGIIRSTDSVALSVLRALEDTLLAGDTEDLSAITSVDVALYVLNQKRQYLKDIEARYGVCINIIADQKLQGANFQIERTENTDVGRSDKNVVVKMDWAFEPPEPQAAKSDEDDGKKRRKRRRKRKDRNDGPEQLESLKDTSEEEISDENPDEEQDARSQDNDEGENGSERRSRTRRRGRRGGRRHRSAHKKENGEDFSEENNSDENQSDDEAPGQPVEARSSDQDESQHDENTRQHSESNDEQGEDGQSSRKDKPRRRFPAGRRRNTRRRNNRSQNDNSSEERSETVSASENRSDSESSVKKIEISEKTEKKEKRSENATSEATEKKSSDRPRRNSKRESSPTPIRTPETVGAGAEKSERKSSAASVVTEAKSDAPARKGWWQKRAQ